MENGTRKPNQGTLPAGHHQIIWQAQKTLAKGVYFYRLTAGSFSATRKLLLVR